jgi:CRP-like cAMP-binding protein
VTRSSSPVGANALLHGLPPALRHRLEGATERVPLVQRQVIWRPGETLAHVFFPLSGVVSILAHGDRNESVEIGVIGSEGLVGLPVFLGGQQSTTTAIVQLPGLADRLRADVFVREADRDASFRQRLHRYAQAFLTEAGQSAVCNRLHRADQRLARWLLACHDRVGANTFALTQDFMAQMLGVRRSTVSVVCTALQRDGLIECSPGRVAILNRRRLEAAACACYRITRRELDRLIERPTGG